MLRKIPPPGRKKQHAAAKETSAAIITIPAAVIIEGAESSAQKDQPPPADTSDKRRSAKEVEKERKKLEKDRKKAEKLRLKAEKEEAKRREKEEKQRKKAEKHDAKKSPPPSGVVLDNSAADKKVHDVSGKPVPSEKSAKFSPASPLLLASKVAVEEASAPTSHPDNVNVKRVVSFEEGSFAPSRLKYTESGLNEDLSNSENATDSDGIFRPVETPPYVSPKIGPRSVTTVVTNEESVHNVPAQSMSVRSPDGGFTSTTTASQIKTVKQTVQTKTYQTYSVPASSADEALGKFTHEMTKETKVENGGSGGPGGSPGPAAASFFATEVSTSSSPPVTATTSAPKLSPIPPDAQFVSSQTRTDGDRTVETITYKTERDGVIETHVEHRVTIHSASEINHDAELSAAILEATKMNPNMTVEKIEVRRTAQTDL